MRIIKSLNSLNRSNTIRKKIDLKNFQNKNNSFLKSSYNNNSKFSTKVSFNQITHPDEPISIKTKEKLEEWSNYMLTPYVRPPIILSHGKGSKVWDLEGREYLDFTAGISVNALGHADEQVAEVIHKESLELVHCSNIFHNKNAGELAKTLVNLTKRFGGLGYLDHSLIGQDDPKKDHLKGLKVFFANSGTEANEGALKFARKMGKIEDPSGKKHRLVCFKNAFHGRTFGSLSVTSQPKYQLPFSPLIPGVVSGDLNNIEDLKDLVNDETCGVIIEPIQAEGGIIDAEESFLRALRARCDEVKAVLIYDEIQCGLGRTGNLWAHGSLPLDCHPDIITMAKPLANGVPIGAIMMTDRVADQIKIGDHGTTFGGGPLQTAIGNHVVKRIGTEDFLKKVKETGSLLRIGMEGLVKKFPEILIGPVRGRGLILGIDVNEKLKIKRFNRGGGVEEVEVLKLILKMNRERGVLVLNCGKNTIRLVPSLILENNEVQTFLNVFESVLVEIEKGKEFFVK